MSKDRNTVAKRQRENEKKRKAQEKREKRRQRKELDDTVASSNESNIQGATSHFSKDELRVFDAFRKYLMTPGQMLCFNAQDIESMKKGLETMIDQGMLVSEGSKGAYSLTREGFDAMKLLG